MTDYDGLVAQLQEWAEDDDLEFQASIDSIIELGERRLHKDLDLSIFQVSDTTVTAVGVSTAVKPVASPIVAVWKSIYYDVIGERTHLELRSVDYVHDHQGANASPVYYAELSETAWELSPIPDAILTLNCRGIGRPAGLSSGNTNTWLGDHVPDLLFKACMAESEGFLKADDRMEMWNQQYVDLLAPQKRELYTMLNAHYNLTPMEVPASPTNQR